ncbi:hypothetical protein JCM10212_000498 [Sporobolomyces blumeae]
MSVSTSSSSPLLSTLPPELVRDILAFAISSSLLTQPIVVHGQFAQLPSTCRTCCYRQVASICSTFADIVRRDYLGRDVVFGVYGSAKDDEVLACVEKHVERARQVRSIDASLRGWQGWRSLPTVGAVDEPNEEGSVGFLETREVQLEKQRRQVLERERQRLVRLLTACTLIESFDVDVGFYNSIRGFPTLFPSSIRSLTLRNAEGQETFDLIENLPLLDDLTLRLALDWRLSPLQPRPRPTCRLRRFELSFTAFATTRLEDVLTLLSSSLESVESLTLRNKGSSAESFESFLPVSRGLIAALAPHLRQLVVKDIPRAGVRCPGTIPTWSWFPPRPTAFPSLQVLHLTGLPSLTAEVLQTTLVLADPAKLEVLTLEDFDSPSPAYLVETLTKSPALSRLKRLRVAVPKRGTDKTDGERDVEAWCEGVGKVDGRKVELDASWRMRKVDHHCGMW